ncbi:MAG: hypothetical protein HY807_02780 [Nitrospirae bacterium]|nr:hypothetical protein [Nitrospirota bacterium]
MYFNEIITAIIAIPDVVWAAIIASFLTLGGVLLTNRGSNKRLTNQLLHDAQQRDRERSMELKREVYLKATEAITVNHMILMKLTNLNVQELEIAQQFSNAAATIAKVNIIASTKTVNAVSDLSSELGENYLQLLAQRIPLVQRKANIEVLNILINKFSSERDQMIELMKKSNIQGNYDERLWKVINDNFEFAGEQIKKYSNERDQLLALNNQELVNFTKDCFQASKKVGNFFIPAIQAIREEMDIPFDEDGYKDTIERSWSKAERSMSKFIEELTNKKNQ